MKRSLLLLPMLLHDFSLQALAALTVLSIALNNLGHSNYEFSARAPARGWRAASRRHHLHHACYHGNYGFLLGIFDRVAGTRAAGEQTPTDEDLVQTRLVGGAGLHGASLARRGRKARAVSNR